MRESINPVAHAFTDAYALIGTIAAIDVLGLPLLWCSYVVTNPTSTLKLEPLSWFGNMPVTSIKWSTAGDAYVNDKDGLGDGSDG